MLLAITLAACGKVASPNEAVSASPTTSAGFIPQYMPDAEFAVASELSSQSLDAAETRIDLMVARKHTFSNGQTFEYTTIGNSVVDADVIFGTTEELEGAFQKYEAYLAEGNPPLTPQGAMYDPYCDVRVVFCFVTAGKKWATNGTTNVVYFDPRTLDQFTTAQRTLIRDAMQHITDKTNVGFQASYGVGNRIEFKKADEGCHSRAGMVGGAQTLNLQVPKASNNYGSCFVNSDRSAGFGTIAHELGHAMGLMHEHSRTDRDSKIDVLVNNLTPKGLDIMSQKYAHQTRTVYDYASIMHYERITSDPSFVKWSGLTIFTTKGYGGRVGNNRLTSLDVQAINQRYP